MRYNTAIIFFMTLALLITGCNNDNNVINTSTDNITTTNNTQITTPEPDDTIDNTTSDIIPIIDMQENTSLNTDVTIIKNTTTTTSNTIKDTDKDTTKDTSSNALKDLLDGKEMQYTGEYTVSAQESMYDMKQVFDLPRYVTIMDTGYGESRTIFDGTSVVTCNSMDDEWQCFRMTMQQPQSLGIEDDVNDDSVKITDLGTCNIGGESGRKFMMVGDDGSKTQACYTNDGILLELAMDSPEYYMVATKITRSIDDSLFVAPAEPQDLPN